MWIIVSFDDEDAVEAVPAHWIKNNMCAWPKKDTKKHIQRRTIPNKFDFNYFKSRILKKGIGTLHEAREMVKLAEETSDLSNIENTKRKKKTTIKNVEPPQYIEKLQLHKNKQNDDLVSREDFDRSITFETSPKKQKTVTSYDFNQNLEHNYKEISTIENCKTQSLKSKLNMIGSRFSNEGHTNHQMSDCSPSKVKRTLFKPISTSIQENKSSSTTPESNHEISSIVYTSSSPFKVISQDNYQSLIPDVHEEIVLSDYNTKQLSNLSHRPSTSTKHNCNDDLKIKNMMPKPYSSTKFNNYIIKDHKRMNEVSPQSNLAITPRGTNSSDQHSDILNRILNVVLKIRYDVQSIQQKQMEMEQALTVAINQVNETKGSTHQNISTEAEDFYLMIPIMDEEQLFIFEEKLLEKSYKLCVVNELKRLQKKELNSTVRGLLKALFNDDVLKEYSYVGQKKKKIFCSLRSCAIVFETIRKMKNFQSSTNATIEDPIKKYIAGAGFRKSSKNID
ncbi:uncharacterized protein LOC132952838 [Metopolophium dirhodum]|uniref:uncharacterized protein LOC132951594 n=1 Tax=Metopolophium dirhodum TaxID=44670 RepID=UPI0029901564|nr:uncharacterized protein LOC132951594 [Metopolophium dirhodum]XP_060879359.1 uncharacterized protein LOC132951594 [Metopolophium dirhodum]XP_060881280.1 uncharacterized protein LOC132952838 [Metopolophium dirhodum]XP_060881281.1 uncharacterized protein LOC132952838 [Metopolophium dirhodum]